MTDQLPPGLPSPQLRLVLVIEAEGAGAETEAYPVKMPKGKGRILIADISNQPPGKKLDFEEHKIAHMEESDWYGKIFVPHLSSMQTIFTIHPDRVFRRRLMQHATWSASEGLRNGRDDLHSRAQAIRLAVSHPQRFRDLAQEFHNPAILTFAERSGFSPTHVRDLLQWDQPVNDEEHLRMMAQLCRSL